MGNDACANRFSIQEQDKANNQYQAKTNYNGLYQKTLL